MPTVFTRDGYRFFFYSNDHRAIHVHVRKGAGEAVFNLEDAIELREPAGLKAVENGIPNLELHAGDRLLVMGTPEAIAALQR